MSRGSPLPRKIAVVGGGPAGSFFALSALDHARRAGRDVSVTIYEGKDFRRFGQPGCNMCAGIIPVSVVRQFGELGITVPPEAILSRISTYALHTSAGSLSAGQPDTAAAILSVYRGAGPRYGHPPGLVSFDEFLVEQAVARGADLRRSMVQAIRRAQPVEVVSAGESERYDLVVLATGVNAPLPALHGFGYRPPPRDSMCQAELYLGGDEVERRLGSAVHIFLPPDDIATYGVLIPKGPFVTVSLLAAADHRQSLRRFLDLDEVTAVLGRTVRRVCGCLPSVSVGPAGNVVDDGFVAIGDASSTRLYKNGIGSALLTARQAAEIAIYQGCSRADFVASYLPLCRAIDGDNRIGKLLFLEVPVLKRFGVMPMAHYRLATRAWSQRGLHGLYMRTLWGMFTGAYSYRDLLRMGATPGLMIQVGLALVRSVFERGARLRPAIE
ncbi:MAG: hypothetical protein HY331_02595 [Chloroflexi bacterium]|nr:hypothetical protein [Chloroflexota bacterium]